ncbi:hypothetical protein ACTMU2_38165 [Cupriavidus basilensis]
MPRFPPPPGAQLDTETRAKLMAIVHGVPVGDRGGGIACRR